MKQKFFVCNFIIGFVVVILSCGKLTEKTEKISVERTNLKVITLWETYNSEEHQVFVDLVKKFEEKNPDIKIRVQRIPWGEHLTKLKVSMVTHTAPDICRVDLAFLPRLVKSRSVIDLTEYGALELAKELVPAAVNSNIFSESFFITNSTSAKKHIFGLPDQTTGVALFYNKKLFRKFGVPFPPQAPNSWTWEEFVEAAKKLTRDTNNDGKPDIYGFAMSGGLWFNFPFFNTFGVKLIDDSAKECILDNSEVHKKAAEVLQFMSDLTNKYRIEAGAWRVGAVTSEMGFLNELYAMGFHGPWNVQRFKEAKLDFGIALIPRGSAGTSTNVGGTNMVILRETKYPKECYEFLKFFCSPEIQAEWCNRLGQIPVNLKAIPLIDFSKNPEIRVFTEQMKTAVARPPVLDYEGLEILLGGEIYAVMSQQKSPEKALKDASEKIKKDVLPIE
ncbi:MAG: ABC transporter substrate-binding protein [Elusimicrobiota bacterium]|nr:ABC transporter substrate-binding protein [Elusimicrobiota bacterium]